MRLLLVEDDIALGSGVATGLEIDGYGVDWVRTVAETRHALELHEYAMCILDLGLPDGDGLQLLMDCRRDGMRLPILVLTARDTLDDRVRGLDLGADDYLVKPVHLLELQARVRAILRRGTGEGSALLTAGAIALDPASKDVTLAGERVQLSAREFALLQDLLMHKGRPRSRAALEASLYAWGHEVESNTVEVYIHHLRRKLGAHHIRTQRGVGYSVEDPA